jgi:ribosomal protein S27AE
MAAEHVRPPHDMFRVDEGARVLPCPKCGESNKLTPHDVRLGYMCLACDDVAATALWPRAE